MKIGNHTCRVWYASRDIQCKRCGGKTHKTSDSAKCDYYTPPLDHVQAFTNGPLSNFNRCPIHMAPLTFETSEHTYQFRACEEHLRPDIDEQVFKAKTPREVKYIAASIKDADPSSHWNTTKYEVMRHVLMAEAESSESFSEYLLESHNKLLVETTSDMYLGSGLSYNLTITTLPEKYPGKNMLGKLLCEIRLLLKNRSAVRNSEAPETGKFQDESAHDGGVQPSTSSTTLILISETEAPLLISDKTSADQGPQTTQSTATLVPGMCDSKSGPAKSSDKLRSQSITSKFHRTNGTRLIRALFKQDSKRKRVISPTLENSHGNSTVPSPVYPFDACSTKHSNLVS